MDGDSTAGAVVYPLDEVRKAVEAGEVTYSEIARRAGKAPQTVIKAMSPNVAKKDRIDPPESVARQYYEALLEIRKEREGAKSGN